LRILSLECSAKAASAAVFEDNILLAEEFNADGKTHSETLCPAAENVIKKVGLSFSDIDIFKYKAAAVRIAEADVFKHNGMAYMIWDTFFSGAHS